MAKKVNVEKILQEFEKGTVGQQVEAFTAIKKKLTENLLKIQEELQIALDSVIKN